MCSILNKCSFITWNKCNEYIVCEMNIKHIKKVTRSHKGEGLEHVNQWFEHEM